jgi:hypothetical protein
MKILQFLIFSLLFAVITTQTGCVSDPCAKISCQNGGNCESGTCKCPAGYYGTTCEKGEVCRISAMGLQFGTDPVISIAYSYDAMGRLTTDSGFGQTSVYTYSTGQLDVQTTYNTSADYQKTKYTLNAKGFPTTAYIENRDGGTISKDTTQYTYDANGYNIGETKSNYTKTITIANGNKVSEIQTGNDSFTGTHEYYLDKIRPSTYNTGYAPTYGVANKNLHKKYTQNYTDGRKQIIDYLYEYDTKGNVTQEISTITSYNAAGAVTNTDIYTYTYTIACVQL